MPRLDVGNMDQVQTKPDTLPAIKKVLFRVMEPQDPATEMVEFKDGKIKAINFSVQVAEKAPYIIEEGGKNVERNAEGRYLSVRCNWFVDRDEYLTWKGSTEAGYANKDFLRGLKVFGQAVGVDFDKQTTEDAYGRTFRADIIQRKYEVDGEERIANELRNFRPA